MIACVQQVEEVNNPLQFTYTPWPPSLPPLRRGGKANFALPEKKKNQNQNRMLLLEVNFFFSLTLLENTQLSLSPPQKYLLMTSTCKVSTDLKSKLFSKMCTVSMLMKTC